MALDPRLTSQNIQNLLQTQRPVQNLLAGVPLGQSIAGEIQRQNILAQQAPVQQQLLEQQAQAGQLDIAMKQRALQRLGVADETEAGQLALDMAKLSALPEDQVLGSAQAIRDAAIANNRSTENIDEFITAYKQNPQKGKALLDASVQAFEKTGFITPDAVSSIKQQQLDLRQQEIALKQQTEQRQATKLSAASEKALIDSQDAALQASQNATEFDILANQLEQSDLSGGIVSSFEEGAARLLGSQDEATELRRRFNNVRLSEGLKNLPPGPATDRDVQEAFKGVPPENAPVSQMVSFLRGAAKMAKFDQAWNEFKSEYISENNNTKGLIPAWKAHAKTIAGGIVENQEQRPTASTFTSSSGIQFTVE